jgi:hypothetical protein
MSLADDLDILMFFSSSTSTEPCSMFIVIGSDGKNLVGWGRGRNKVEAYAEAYKAGGGRGCIKDYLLYQVCPGTTCLTIGKQLHFQYPVGGIPPHLLLNTAAK